MAQDKLIEITNLCFRYGHEAVLKNISVCIGRGERWAVIGRNGAGKSTLVKCIARLERPYSGAISISGKDISGLDNRHLAHILTYVPQGAGRSIPFTAFDYIMMGRFSFQNFMAVPSKKDKEAVAEAMELTDTVMLANRIMNTLSGGEMQRVLLAGAVSQQAEIMLFDEPSTYLDPLHQELICSSIERIHARYNTTILTVTHDINDAILRYENVIALIGGTVCYAGTSRDLLADSQKLKQIFGLCFEEGIIPSSQRKFLFPVSCYNCETYK